MSSHREMALLSSPWHRHLVWSQGSPVKWLFRIGKARRSRLPERPDRLVALGKQMGVRLHVVEQHYDVVPRMGMGRLRRPAASVQPGLNLPGSPCM